MKRNAARRPGSGSHLTTAQVAAVLGCCARTAAKLIDQGVIRGHRIGTATDARQCDRRVRVDDLAAYCRARGIDAACAGEVVLLGGGPTLGEALERLLPGARVRRAACLFSLGVLCERHAPAAVVIDLGACDPYGAALAAAHLAARPGPSPVALASEDRPEAPAGFGRCLGFPASPEAVAAAIS